MTTHGLGLIPLRNFGHITNNVFRSAQPIEPYEYAWIKNVLKIDMIINLREELDHDSGQCKQFGIEAVTVKVKDHFPPTDEQAKEFINLLKKNKSKRILIHCEHGHGRTSTFSVLSKVANGWE